MNPHDHWEQLRTRFNKFHYNPPLLESTQDIYTQCDKKRDSPLTAWSQTISHSTLTSNLYTDNINYTQLT